MKILILMSDSRSITTDIDKIQYNSLAALINYNYALHHGYDFIYLQPYNEVINEDNRLVCKDLKGNLRDASWAKLLSVYKYMNKGYDYIVYTDSDAILKNKNIKVESFIERYNSDFVFFDNSPDILKGILQKGPCAGFFITKVTTENKQLIANWYNIIDPSYNQTYFWEQGVLWGYKPLPNTINVPEPHFEEYEGQFMRHVCSAEAGIRYSYFKDIIDKENYNLNDIINIPFISYNTNTITTI